MAKPAKPKNRISISLSPEEKSLLAQIAGENQISIARVVREAITEFLNGSERQLFLFKPISSSRDGVE